MVVTLGLVAPAQTLTEIWLQTRKSGVFSWSTNWTNQAPLTRTKPFPVFSFSQPNLGCLERVIHWKPQRSWTFFNRDCRFVRKGFGEKGVGSRRLGKGRNVQFEWNPGWWLLFDTWCRGQWQDVSTLRCFEVEAALKIRENIQYGKYWTCQCLPYFWI